MSIKVDFFANLEPNPNKPPNFFWNLYLPNPIQTKHILWVGLPNAEPGSSLLVKKIKFVLTNSSSARNWHWHTDSCTRHNGHRTRLRLSHRNVRNGRGAGGNRLQKSKLHKKKIKTQKNLHAASWPDWSFLLSIRLADPTSNTNHQSCLRWIPIQEW